jgi:hypothetical protein
MVAFAMHLTTGPRKANLVKARDAKLQGLLRSSWYGSLATEAARSLLRIEAACPSFWE